MDTIKRAREVHGARAKRIIQSALHMTRKVRAAPQHLRRRRPVRPLSLVPDMGDAGPGKSGPSDSNPISERLVIRQNQVKSAFSGANDDGARDFPPVKRYSLARDWRCDRLQLRIERIGEYRPCSGAEKKAGREGGGADQIAAHDFPRSTTLMNARRPPRLRRDSLMAQLWRKIGPVQCIGAIWKSRIGQLR